MPPSTSHHTLPAFPPELATAPLVSLSLAKLEVSESAESTRLFQACKDLGFFYLDMLGSSLGETIVQQAEDLNKLQTEFFSLDYTVKDQYGRDKIDPFFAYRFASAGVTHDGKELRNESYNVSPVTETEYPLPLVGRPDPFRYARMTFSVTAIRFPVTR
jgi:isopenicillin N synthase-like dioxygenase